MSRVNLETCRYEICSHETNEQALVRVAISLNFISDSKLSSQVNLATKSSGLFEKRDKSTVDMRSHDSVHCSDEFSADENDGKGEEEEPKKESLDCVAHATAAHLENDHGETEANLSMCSTGSISM
uniref:Uncharacterized protein n=1 Tax=Cannabis sativa TaxID=3483 RepID=A0A803QMM6_CANSA